jgi:hypothetical protein
VKKLILTAIFSLVLFFALGTTKPIFAQSCTCTVGDNRITYVLTPCQTGYNAACTGDPYKGTLGCSCSEETSGITCLTAGSPCNYSSKPCCNGASCTSGLCPNSSGTDVVLKATACDFIKDSTQKGECTKCFQKQGGAWTAIGCIPTNLNGLVGTLLTFGMGIAGGIAFLLILMGGFQILTSAGNPEQLNAGKELVSSAITGLILIIFSVFILKIIGVDILGLPKWK